MKPFLWVVLLMSTLCCVKDVSAMDDITRDQAVSLGQTAVAHYCEGSKNQLVVLDKNISEHKSGWLFVPIGKEYAETGDDKYFLFGTPGFFVKKNGDIIRVPSLMLLQHGVDEYVERVKH